LVSLLLPKKKPRRADRLTTVVVWDHGLQFLTPGIGCRAAADGAAVPIVSWVVAGCPFAGVTEEGLKRQLTPAGNGVEQLSATVVLKPPLDVTVSVKTADWPGDTDAEPGALEIAKSGGTIVIVMAPDALARLFASPL
jgi:hypothetical protein